MRWSRRRFLSHVLPIGALLSLKTRDACAAVPDLRQSTAAAGTPRATIADTVLSKGAATAFRPTDFSMVGQYDIAWLLEPAMQRLLDNMAASPSAFGSVRFFHALDSGTPAKTIDDDPLDGGRVWPRADAPTDFSKTFAALETLVRRGFVPFVGLNFFPTAVSAQAATPPADFANWKELIRRFLHALVGDPRFGSDISKWYFEVWNEPNGRPFWRGDYSPGYFNLYRATSEAVVETGYPVRLGGPAIVYRAGTAGSQGEIEAFLRFLSSEPSVKCDFISLHAKGSWSPDDEPDFSASVTAAIETAEIARSGDPQRFFGLPIINDECDMRVGFDIPYMARMDQRFAAWLCSLMIAYDQLNERFRETGFRFMAASDNANQQLIQTIFDGRRSLTTRASNSARDLIKLPVFNFYEILRLTGDRHGSVVSGSEHIYPNTELFHLVTVADSHVAIVFVVQPRTRSETPGSWTVDFTLKDIPWANVNIAEFRIDADHSNSFASAQQGYTRPYPAAAEIRRLRNAQEFAARQPIARGVTLTDGAFHQVLTIDPWAVAALWVTPVADAPPADPKWIETTVEDGNVILRWTPNREPFFYSYEVYLLPPGAPPSLISPEPLRSAMWVDTTPPSGMRAYGVRAVTASGVTSTLIRTEALVL
jgi:Glycosyl hydrolases family 39